MTSRLGAGLGSNPGANPAARLRTRLAGRLGASLAARLAGSLAARLAGSLAARLAGSLMILLLLASCASLPPSTEELVEEGHRASDLVVMAMDIWEQERQDEAISYLEEALEIEPDALAAYLLAQRYRDQGRLQDAETAFGRALEINPNFARVLHERGRMRLWELPGADPAAAYRDLEMAHLLDPANARYAEVWAGELRWSEAGLPAAAEVYRRLIEANPDSALAQLRYGEISAEMGNLSQARTSFSRVEELLASQHDSYVFRSLALGLIRWTDQERGRELVEIHLAASEHDPWDLSHMAKELAQLGEWSSSRRAFSISRSMDVDFQEYESFLFGLASYLDQGDTLPFQEYLAIAEDPVQQAGAAFAIAWASRAAAMSVDAVRASAEYQTLERVVLEHWGPIEDKRPHHPWLDEILKVAGL